MIRRPPRSTLFPSPPLFRSLRDPRAPLEGPPRPPDGGAQPVARRPGGEQDRLQDQDIRVIPDDPGAWDFVDARSEEHTSELQSRLHLVCRLLLEKKKNAEHP